MTEFYNIQTVGRSLSSCNLQSHKESNNIFSRRTTQWPASKQKEDSTMHIWAAAVYARAAK